ncbi:hypothetical protein [Candidatus Leptofilum sp.]|uniref:hypothetical protein n=1 Tax=Candidatus Leptofilum sp. TaxID=3241576 RepID=UPI003B5A2254
MAPPPPRELFKAIKEGLIVGLSEVLDVCFQVTETRQKTEPNQGIHSSLRNFWRMSGLYSMLLGLLGVFSSLLLTQLGSEVAELAPLAISLFVIMGIFNGFWEYGGDTVVKHYVLRWVLARQNMLPFPLRDKKLIGMLDSMVERILLRRAGNGYAFIHRSLLEHFAAKHPAHQPSSNVNEG